MSNSVCPNDFHEENCPFLVLEKNRLRTDHPTIRPSIRRTDTPSYRDGWTHLKSHRVSERRKKNGDSNTYMKIEERVVSTTIKQIHSYSSTNRGFGMTPTFCHFQAPSAMFPGNQKSRISLASSLMESARISMVKL